MSAKTLYAGILPALLLSVGTTATAQSGFPGQYDLEGRYSNRRATTVDLKIIKNGSWNSYTVIRTARITSGSGSPDFTWSGSARIKDRVMKVVYEVPLDPDADTDTNGLIGNLDPDSTSTRDALALLGRKNVIEAIYLLSRNGKQVREIALNTTRLGPQRGWRWLSTKGKRKAAPTTGGLTAAKFERKAKKTLKDWYTDYIEEAYVDELAEATTDEERRKLEEEKKEDLDFDSIEIMGDEYDYFENALSGDEEYLDSFGKAIPPARMKVYMLSMYPNFAGIGLSKVFLFDTKDGSVIDESEVHD